MLTKMPPIRNNLYYKDLRWDSSEEKYEIIREIGRGGMGIVYEAVNKKLGKKVALKKMREELAINPREKERFLKEARKVAELHHPNIVDIYDIIEEEIAREIYLVFEFVDGKTVEEILSTAGKFSVEEAAEIIKQVCEALKYAHGKKIIHRDIKPSNIIVSKSPLHPPLSKGERGELVKVMDFGIARQAKDTFSRVSGKDTSGTLAYMAPEQELGSYSEQSDIFSVGVCFYEMITGEVPFKGPNFLAQKREMIYRKVREFVGEKGQSPSTTSSVMGTVPIEAIIEKCLQPEKEKRYQSVKELIEETMVNTSRRREI